MPYSKQHTLVKKEDRKPRSSFNPVPTRKEVDKFNKVDAVVDLVYEDIARAVSRSEIEKKLQEGKYKFQEKTMTRRTAESYYNMALKRFSTDCDIEAQKLKDMFYGRYENLLQEAIKSGDIYNARCILDSMSRIFGVENSTPSTAIQINSTKDNGVTVNFGFTNDAKD